jgi:hypothetical protein
LPLINLLTHQNRKRRYDSPLPYLRISSSTLQGKTPTQLGYLLEAFIAGATGGGQRALSEGHYWYLTVLLNISLSLFDEKRLKNAGHETRRLKGWVFIVPVYLYQRAKMLNQNLAYFIVWLGSFAITLFA